MHARAASAYRKVAVESASPARVLDELFRRIRLDFQLARSAIEGGDVAGRCTALSEAMHLVGALESGLDTAVAPDLCANLRALYRFVGEQIFIANTEVSAEPLNRADEVIAEVHEAFSASVAGAKAA